MKHFGPPKFFAPPNIWAGYATVSTLSIWSIKVTNLFK